MDARLLSSRSEFWFQHLVKVLFFKLIFTFFLFRLVFPYFACFCLFCLVFAYFAFSSFLALSHLYLRSAASLQCEFVNFRESFLDVLRNPNRLSSRYLPIFDCILVDSVLKTKEILAMAALFLNGCVCESKQEFKKQCWKFRSFDHLNWLFEKIYFAHQLKSSKTAPSAKTRVYFWVVFNSCNNALMIFLFVFFQEICSRSILIFRA